MYIATREEREEVKTKGAAGFWAGPFTQLKKPKDPFFFKRTGPLF